MSRGVITAMDDYPECFSSFKLLYSSLKLVSPDLPLTMVDLGMTNEQRSFIESLEGVEIMELEEVAGPLPFPSEEKVFRWHSWNKPCYMRSSPYKESVWLDVDCICFRPLDDLFALSADHILVAEDCAQQAFPHIEPIKILSNKTYTYSKYPVTHRLSDGPFVNTGVLSFRPNRDKYFFDKWINFTYKCYEDKELRESIAWWDQGACQYIIEQNGWSHCILHDIRWNHSSPTYGPRTSAEFYGGPLKFLHDLNPCDVCIGHFAGYPKPWGELRQFPIRLLKTVLQPYCHDHY